jgi:glutaminase
MAGTDEQRAAASDEAIQRTIDALHERYRGCDEGELASYIPELASVDPSKFGLAVCTADGRLFTSGDASHRFTIQSISKPLIYGMALEDRGREETLRRVGVEPTGDSFNSIIKLDAANRPHNPMVNAGAIATTDLIVGDNPTARLRRMLSGFSAFLGEDATVDTPVFVSERSTGHRNRAIAHLLLNFGMITGDVNEVLDLYFQQCSVRVTTASLAVVAATLANGGVNPRTGARALHPNYIRDVLTVMFTCGMYNYAGQWAYTIGLPAKSGVAGGLIAVAPGRYGIAAYSPLLDEHSHPVRGLRVCEDLSQNSRMHVFDTLMTRGLDASSEPESYMREGASAPEELPVAPPLQRETRRDRFVPSAEAESE